MIVQKNLAKRAVVIHNLGATLRIALGFRRGEAVLVGSDGSVQGMPIGSLPRVLEPIKARGDTVTEVNANGGVLLPGYHNCHYHTIYALFEALRISYAPFGKINKRELCDALKPEAQDQERRAKGIIMAYGLNTTRVNDLTREHLDNVESELPVIVFDASYHGAVANTAALRLIKEKALEKAGETGTPLIGECKDNGQLTEDYVFLGFALMDDKFGRDFGESVTNQAEVIFEWLKRQVRKGITSMGDLVSFTPAHALAVIKAAERWEQEEGTSSPIVNLCVRPEVLKMVENNPEKYAEVKKAFDRWAWQKRLGIKLFADGSIGSFTARVNVPYVGTDINGTIFDSIERAREAVDLAKGLGLLILRMHAIGDDGIRHALIVMEHARRVLGQDAYLGIEHFELGGYREISEAAKRTGVVVCIQPNFGTDYDDYAGRLGQDRILRINPVWSLHKKHIPITFGDDGMPASALGTIHAATHHPVGVQRLGVEEAVSFAAGFRGSFPDRVPDLMIADPSAVGSLYSDGKSESQILAEMTSRTVWGNVDRFDRAITHVILSGKVM